MPGMPPGFNMEAMNSMFQNPAFQNVFLPLQTLNSQSSILNPKSETLNSILNPQP
jgi:hypothetical protein